MAVDHHRGALFAFQWLVRLLAVRSFVCLRIVTNENDVVSFHVTVVELY